MADEPIVVNPDVPAGMMRVWNPQEKKVVLVPAWPSGPDLLTLTLRVHDPKEKQDVTMSACWLQVKVPRAAVGTSTADFIAKYIAPVLSQLKNLQLT